MSNGSMCLTLFQSTLSMRRATRVGVTADAIQVEFQSTLSMRRATSSLKLPTASLSFQSTLSMRRATEDYESYPQMYSISIHALHEESDHARHTAKPAPIGHFNPRSP